MLLTSFNNKDIDKKSIELLKLATAQRMNTDIRSKIFCIIMGSQNCIEAIKSISQLSLRVRYLLSTII